MLDNEDQARLATLFLEAIKEGRRRSRQRAIHPSHLTIPNVFLVAKRYPKVTPNRSTFAYSKAIGK